MRDSKRLLLEVGVESYALSSPIHGRLRGASEDARLSVSTGDIDPIENLQKGDKFTEGR